MVFLPMIICTPPAAAPFIRRQIRHNFSSIVPKHTQQGTHTPSTSRDSQVEFSPESQPQPLIQPQPCCPTTAWLQAATWLASRAMPGSQALLPGSAELRARSAAPPALARALGLAWGPPTSPPPPPSPGPSPQWQHGELEQQLLCWSHRLTT